MTDTQWSRWEVFKQDTPKKPHQAVGSVHAADPEHALLTARNIFVRRPQAVSLWVVLAEQVFSMTAEVLAKNLNWDQEELSPDASSQTYYIFRKTSHRNAMTFVDHIGELAAPTPKQALRHAIDTFTDAAALAWWIVPAEAVVRSDPDVVESWFEPAKEKTYKQQSAYGFVSSRRKTRNDT